VTCDSSCLPLRAPVARLAAVLSQHPHHHPPINRLAHVVNCQQANLHRGQRLHLDPGLADGFDLGPAMYRMRSGI
jgi:hypothetical protein